MKLMKCMLAVAAFASLSGAASAESVRERQERACQADAMKFCKDLIPDENKIEACMGQHRSELSIPCGILFDAGGKK